jgi:hypothetical protein
MSSKIFEVPLPITPIRLKCPRPSASCLWLVALAAPVVGCGRDGSVAARGIVTVEGQAAATGRLLLTPVGEGKRANSLVGEQGEFALRTDGADGSYPGSYQVLFSRELVADGTAAPPGGGAVPVGELTVLYQSPPGAPIVIPAEGAEQLAIEIRSESGWTRSISE